MKRLWVILIVLGWGRAPVAGAEGSRPSPEPGPAIDLSGTVWAQAAAPRHLDPYLLYAIALVESARVSQGWARPWPWALNEAGRTAYPPTPEAALDRIRRRVAAGQWATDVGLMQISLRWHGRRADRLEALLDPVTNVQLGAEILAEALASAPGDPALGVGRYHHWRNRRAAYRYGHQVLALADRLRPAETR